MSHRLGMAAPKEAMKGTPQAVKDIMTVKRLQLVSNKARCRQCDDVIESTHRHDFVWCKCGAIAVDGGTAYLKRCGDLTNFEELSEEIEVDVVVECESCYRESGTTICYSHRHKA